MTSTDEYTSRIFLECRNTYSLAKRLSSATSPNAVAVDLGLNVGGFPIEFSKYFKRIISVEPSSFCIEQARKNFSLSGVDNVEVIQRAISDTSGDTINLHRVYVDGKFESKDFTIINFDNSLVADSGYRGNLGEVEETCETINFTELLSMTSVTSIDFLKVDIEGAEFDALIGQDLSMVSAIVAEVHYSFLGREKVVALVNHLLKYFEFVNQEDEEKFLTSWPPPSILKMVKWENISRRKRMKLRLISKIRKLVLRVRAS